MTSSTLPTIPVVRKRRRVPLAVLAKIGRDVSLLLDARDEATNNAIRGETEFLRGNLKTCRALARRIEQRTLGKRARRLIATTERRGC